jgi:transcriptional regulator with XRE-family HTH domain
MNASEWALTADNARLIREIVATNLRRERERTGMSHRTLAGRSGLGTGTVARIEASRREAKISTLVAFSFGLYVPLPSLLVGVPSPEPNESLWVVGPTNAAGWTLTPENARLIREVVGRNLRHERERAGMSQLALAHKSRVGEDTIVRTEGTRQEPRLFTLVALSFSLYVPLTSLLVGVPSP